MVFRIFSSSLCLLVAFLIACDKKPTAKELSDPQAIEIAEQVIEASGGRENWENTSVVTWKTFGKRLNVWDKRTNDIRIESRVSTILMNLDTMKGKGWQWGQEITDPDKLVRAMDYGYEAWINDTYWILMPFKLLDDGVILKYVGEDTTDGHDVDVLELTFDEVGLTPNNKYHIYVDKESRLVVRWDYYMDREDPEPRVTTPWGDYQKYGDILLSSDRGQKKHTNIAVFDDVADSVFTSPKPVPWIERDPKSDPWIENDDETGSLDKSEATN